MFRILFIALALVATPAVAAEMSLGTEAAFTLQSKAMGEARPVRVFLPAGYESGNDIYDVLYVTDANGQLPTAAGVTRFLTVHGRAPRVMVVGVDSLSSQDRARNFTTVGDPRRTDMPGGGFDKFASFLIDELVPHIDKTYRTSSRRLFAGHSLAGLGAINVWLREPNIFEGVISISPSLTWSNGEVFGRIARRLDASAPAPFLFVSMGSGDLPGYPDAMKRFEEMLRSVPSSRRPVTARFAGEDHVTTVVPALSRGLLAFYAQAPGIERRR